MCGCDPSVVDAVREPAPAPTPTTTSSALPLPPSPLESSLIHRYSFDGDGTDVLDSKGAAHGLLRGTTLPGSGQLTLAGERSGQYVDLPNGIVQGLGDATFEAWLTWNGGGAWQRIFDFGNSSADEGTQGNTGTSYLFLTTVSSPDTPDGLPPALRLVYSQKGTTDENICSGSSPFPIGSPTHIAAVIQQATQSMAVYQDGALLVDCTLSRPLKAIDDKNNWLGHSNYAADVDLSATYDEFRIYSAALTPTELSKSFAAGPDALR
jgi:hypothetical protein